MKNTQSRNDVARVVAKFPYRLKKWPRTLTNLSIGITSALVLSGCLLNRAFEAKEQFCAYDANFSLTVSDHAVFEFRNPVFIPSDVEMIVGHSPRKITSSGDELTWHYEIEKISADPTQRMRYSSDLVFLQSEDEFKLSRIKFPALIGQMVREETMQSTADEICSASLPLISRAIEEDMSDRQISQLPSRQELISWVGEPSRLVDGGKGLEYEYYLVGEGEPVTVAEFTVWYESGDDLPSRMESKSRRAKTTADVAARKIRVSYRS